MQDSNQSESYQRLDELEKEEDSLQQEMNQLRHELRRVKDIIERESGAGHGLEKQAAQLGENIKLCENDLRQNLSLQNNVSVQIRESYKQKSPDR